MSAILARFIKETASHEARSAVTPKGSITYAAARSIKCCKRRGDKVVQDSSNGEQFMPALVVWAYDKAIKYGDKLDGRTVRRIEESTELRGPATVVYYAG